MTIRRELMDELLKDYPDPQDILAEDGLLKQLTKAVLSVAWKRNWTRIWATPNTHEPPML